MKQFRCKNIIVPKFNAETYDVDKLQKFYSFRSEQDKRLSQGSYEYCESMDFLEVHHMRAFKDLDKN